MVMSRHTGDSVGSHSLRSEEAGKVKEKPAIRLQPRSSPSVAAAPIIDGVLATSGVGQDPYGGAAHGAALLDGEGTSPGRLVVPDELGDLLS